MTVVGGYNVEIGHDHEAWAHMIIRRFREEDLEVLALNEISEYAHALESLLPDSMRLLWIKTPINSRNAALLVRKNLSVGRVRSIDMPATYYAPDGSLRRSSNPLVAVVDDVMYVVVHLPVGAWMLRRSGWHWVGPLRRRIAYRRYILRLLSLIRAHPRQKIVIIGDWNATPETVGRWSPNWLRREAGAHFIRPHENTGHGEIDFAIVRHVEGHLSVRHHRPEPSDHFMIAGRVA